MGELDDRGAIILSGLLALGMLLAMYMLGGLR
jgi:hypothetical protein